MNIFPTNYLVCFINLFFVPVLSLAFLQKQGMCSRSFCMDTLIWYAVSVVSNVILTRVFVILLKMSLGMNVANDGAWYTVCAVISAVIIPFAADFLRKCRESAKVEGDEK